MRVVLSRRLFVVTMRSRKTILLFYSSAGDNVLNLLLEKPKKIGQFVYNHTVIAKIVTCFHYGFPGIYN